jgi:flagellar biosynthesis/type III secretory pathway protein FliH
MGTANAGAAMTDAAMTYDAPYMPLSTIIKAADMSALSDAASMRKQAEDMLRQANMLVTQSEIEAANRGHEAGLVAGRDMALKSLALVMSDLRNRAMEREADLSQVVVAAVSRIIGELPAEVQVRGVVHKALQDFADQNAVVILVCPEEKAKISTLIAGNNLQTAGGSNVIREIKADPALEPGDMIIETDHGRYNIGLRSQLRRLTDGLKSSGALPGGALQ